MDVRHHADMRSFGERLVASGDDLSDRFINDEYPPLEQTPALPDEITFITSQELETRFPELTRRERENHITCEKMATTFISERVS